MNKVFPLKCYRQHDRSLWGVGPWESELEDREQWADPFTGYPCLAIRCDLGMWSGYVGVYPGHPAFGQKIGDELPAKVNDYGYTDEVRFIEPPPNDPNAVVDEDDPKESILQVVRLPDYLWFFGFDFAHAGDLIPGINLALQNTLNKCGERQLGTYKDLAYTKKTCAKIALALCEYSKISLTARSIRNGIRRKLVAC